jgi:3-hydroxyisobutyrate dehydrogenase
MERVGFVGMGTMGVAMAANIARNGFPLTVWNRTAGKAGPVLELGATEANTPKELAQNADVIVVCVSDTPDVEAALFGDEGVASGVREGALVIDDSTISPSASRGFAERLRAQGVGFVDAPVSGGSEGAQKGTLTIFVGGSGQDFERAQPVLAAMGKTITHMGPVGAGQAAKAVNQVILAGAYLGVAEGIVLGIKAGLDPEQLVQALSGGAARSWVLENRSARMIANEYPLGFKTSLHLKDLNIALQLAREVGAAMPVAAIVSQIETGLVAQGHANEDMSNVARTIRGLSGLES